MLTKPTPEKYTTEIFPAVIPLSLYIHLPWCTRKCPYCDFNSHPLRTTLPETKYIDCLLQDLDDNLPLIWGRRPISIFFGGGTPSLFSPSAIEQILTGIHSRLLCSPDLEITLEANPGSVEQAKFEGFRGAGINRLSLGIQSLQETQLKKLGRVHGRDEALHAIEAVSQAGFENFNIDLMFGLPQQTVAEALQDLAEVLAFQPTHLSWYQLTLEPNTYFYQHPPSLPDDEILWQIYQEGKALLVSHGYQQYEVSAYSKKERECVHNRNYWEFGDYLGIGAGAHSKLTLYEPWQITRHRQPKHPQDYLIATSYRSPNQVVVQSTDAIFEFMLNALRLSEGIPFSLITERTGLTLTSIQPQLLAAREKGLLIDSQTTLKPTIHGQQFLNDLTALFLPTLK